MDPIPVIIQRGKAIIKIECDNGEYLMEAPLWMFPSARGVVDPDGDAGCPLARPYHRGRKFRCTWSEAQTDTVPENKVAESMLPCRYRSGKGYGLHPYPAIGGRDDRVSEDRVIPEP